MGLHYCAVAILTAILIAIGAIIVSGDSFSLKEMIHDLMNMDIDWPKHLGLYIVEILIMIITSVVKTIMQIYAAVTIGHQAQNHTTLASIGAYIVILIFESVVGRMLLPLFAHTGYGDDGFLNFTMIFIPGVIATIALSAVYFFVCKYLMEKHLNLN